MARDSSAGSRVSVTGILGGSQTQVSNQDVRGGQVFFLFGGGDIDLCSAALADGEATIRIVALFGGVRLFVPEDWGVNVKTGAVIGGINSKRTAPADPTAQLTLTGFCLFGGVEIVS